MTACAQTGMNSICCGWNLTIHVRSNSSECKNGCKDKSLLLLTVRIGSVLINLFFAKFMAKKDNLILFTLRCISLIPHAKKEQYILQPQAQSSAHTHTALNGKTLRAPKWRLRFVCLTVKLLDPNKSSHWTVLKLRDYYRRLRQYTNKPLQLFMCY